LFALPQVGQFCFNEYFRAELLTRLSADPAVAALVSTWFKCRSAPRLLVYF
jgi:hypothetical protein